MNRYLTAAITILVLAGGYWIYTKVSAPTPLVAALRDGSISASVGVPSDGAGSGGGSSGGGVSRVTIRITRAAGASGGLSLIIPAGTVIANGQSEGQRLMTAKTVVVALPDGTSEADQDVEVYCIDEFAETPTPQSVLSVQVPADDEASDETEPLHKLATCLDDKDMPHADKQLAVWLVSSGLLQKSPSDALEAITDSFEQRMIAEKRATLDRDGRQFLKERHPSFSDADIAALLEGELNSEAAKIHEQAAQGASEQLTRFRANGRAPLEACGYEPSDMLIF